MLSNFRFSPSLLGLFGTVESIFRLYNIKYIVSELEDSAFENVVIETEQRPNTYSEKEKMLSAYRDAVPSSLTINMRTLRAHHQ